MAWLRYHHRPSLPALDLAKVAEPALTALGSGVVGSWVVHRHLPSTDAGVLFMMFTIGIASWVSGAWWGNRTTQATRPQAAASRARSTALFVGALLGLCVGVGMTAS